MSAARAAAEDEYPVLPAPTARLAGRALGIDIGGTGVKAAVVDLASGRLVSDRVRELTPHPATIRSLMGVVSKVVGGLDASGALTSTMPGGVGFPSVIRAGRALTGTQLDPEWIGSNVRQRFEKPLGRRMLALADTDAALVAEMAYGAGRGQRGVVLMLNLGTGIGSALAMDGHLVPNMQLGHLRLRGRDAETRVSRTARKRRGLGWKRWSREFNELLAQYEEYIWPDLIILGGGMARELAEFEGYLQTRAPLVAAALGNNAGIVGAARVGAHAARASSRGGRGRLRVRGSRGA